ncbi:hypothetical protein ASPVEDRAFT_741216 [Aspergillus versicolor CBS 583.65]|uniref:Uncharacterized protein n=1 Tax=Aspergillus versicolor CBS 583.65 TaxID=1036611 RepID=A0A1L9PPZ5_ASPVE|nr:uncharacterized protein ASPVEDRAFT_741216 [Aspergillus versicolor CBS 583.65]OJJ03598.1 hypothetical protein ASPVEDRAFT_741216 [Aspergillus versicolor CBS 583.65]
MKPLECPTQISQYYPIHSGRPDRIRERGSYLLIQVQGVFSIKSLLLKDTSRLRILCLQFARFFCIVVFVFALLVHVYSRVDVKYT